jgi:hypothetical protein
MQELSASVFEDDDAPVPLDSISLWLTDNKYAFDRDENSIVIGGTDGSAEYAIGFDWDAEQDLLAFACRFDLPAPEARYGEIGALILMTNKELSMGHFEHWPDKGPGSLLYRTSMVLPEGVIHDEQCRALMELGLSAFDSYLNAFRLVSADTPAAEAFRLMLAIGNTVGTA